jgi:dTDP-glucose 4,6-dehydratase
LGVTLVTGGAGFLGQHVVAALAARGEVVAVVDDLSTPGARVPPGASHWLSADLTADPGRVINWLDTVGKVDRVWHMASPASPPLYKRRKVETLELGGRVTGWLLDVARGHDARFLFISSSEVYGDPETSRQQEDQPSRIHPTGPRSCYDAAKVYGEALCAAYSAEHGVDTRIARVFNTYGPRQDHRDGRLVPALVYAGLTGTPFLVHGDGLQTRTLGFVDDTVAGLMLLMDGPRVDLCARPVNVGGESEVSVIDLVRLVQDVVGPFPLVFGSRQDEHDPRRRRPNLIRLRSLGWSPSTALVEGIRLTASWMREELGR